MGDYINTKKEQFSGFYHFKENVLPSIAEFDYRPYKKTKSSFFEKYRFSVSMVDAEYYKRHNGIESDKYLSGDLFYYYIVPALNRYDFINAYIDKNIYDKLFAGFLQPQTIIHNINGHYSDTKGSLTQEEALDAVMLEKQDLILKPTVETCDGRGIQLISVTNKNKEELRKYFEEYKYNFIVQERVVQCAALNRLNPTSLNTLRIFTYRTLEGECVCLPYTFVRFGGEGSIKDNASTGGGFCTVKDGLVDDKIYYFKSFRHGSLKLEKGIENLQVPNFSGAIALALQMHSTLPYFDIVGWDIGIDENENPIFLEYNLLPGCEAPQMANGPFFGDYIDEVMARVTNCSKASRNCVIITYENGSKHTMLV